MTEQRSSGESGLMGILTQSLATLTRYSITLPFYPLRWLPESLRGSASQPITSLLEASAVFPRALIDGLNQASLQLSGREAAADAGPTMERPGLFTYRDEDQSAAIVFIHGFYLNAENTWGDFPRLVTEEPQLAHWDVFSIGYATNLWIDVAGLWKASPPIDRLALLLDTVCKNEPLDRYDAIALVAHSMGGLVVQRALVDSEDLRRRVAYLTLYGTPSNGLVKANLIKVWKRQIRDMAAGSPFILDLRRRWGQDIGEKPTFSFLTVAGDQDELVPSTSSIEPFPERYRAIIPGDHLTIVNAKGAKDLEVQVLIKHLTNAAAPAGPWNSARVAVQSREFQRAIDELWPHRAELDDATLVTLALALSSVGRDDDAIALLKESGRNTTDQMGTLGGRLKRRWLAERKRDDAEEALRLYMGAYAEAKKKKDAAQGFYHAINVAFMELAYKKDKEKAKEYARHALGHCAAAEEDLWRFATEGEANLYLGHDDEAVAGYKKALEYEPKPWQLASMYEQACRVTELLGKPTVSERLRKVFREQDQVKEAEEGPGE
ncbi:MAG TPA: tetratricopeptide repeat-containing protein [Thermoanaerobaculia bacterium]|jgi:pimeloyl-ACP methyl ester carboxylesterase